MCMLRKHEGRGVPICRSCSALGRRRLRGGGSAGARLVLCRAILDSSTLLTTAIPAAPATNTWRCRRLSPLPTFSPRMLTCCSASGIQLDIWLGPRRRDGLRPSRSRSPAHAIHEIGCPPELALHVSASQQCVVHRHGSWIDGRVGCERAIGLTPVPRDTVWRLWRLKRERHGTLAWRQPDQHALGRLTAAV